MKKMGVLFPLMTVFILTSCAGTAARGNADTQAESAERFESSDMEAQGDASVQDTESAEDDTDTEIRQGGPYGEISITLPEGWAYELCPIDSDRLQAGLYGIHFHPEKQAEGYIELCYMESFGVCGMGLEQTEATLAGGSANIGTFDNGEYWDFVSFHGENEGIVALTFGIGDSWPEYEEQVFTILDTLRFDRDNREGAASIDDPDTAVEAIGLYAEIRNITPARATLVFRQSGKEPSGELTYSDDFVIETLENGQWIPIPTTVDGDYGFHDIAYLIPGGGTSQYELDWEWLYGELPPGEYRIGKTINDFRETGDFDSYMIYVHFILNG